MDIIYLCMWALIAVCLFILEAVTPALVSIWFGIGAIAAFISGFITDIFWVQMLVFALVSFLTLIFTRPLVKKYISQKTVPTNIDTLIGRICVIKQPITPINPIGQANLDDVVWLVKSEQPDVTFQPMEKAVIKAIEGNKLVISKFN